VSNIIAIYLGLGLILLVTVVHISWLSRYKFYNVHQWCSKPVGCPV